MVFFCSASFAKDLTDKNHQACAAVKICLGTVLPGCSEKDFEPVEKVEYTPEFCSVFVDLQSRGIDMKSPVSKEMFGHLGGRYRVTYENSGKLPVSGDMMSYLFDHFPFTTVLVNLFQKTEYSIHYNSRDHRLFSGTNGGHLYGDFFWVLQDSAQVGKGFHNVFYGSGRCKILRWNLHGIAIAILDMQPHGDHTFYKFKAIVFPANAVLNSIMKMGFFRDVVDSKIGEIIDNISASSESYVAGNHIPVDTASILKKAPYAKELAEFRKVAAGELKWTVGNALEQEREQKTQTVRFVTEIPMMFKKPVSK